MISRCSIFDICNQIWYSDSFDHFYMTAGRKQISFKEFALIKANYEFLEEFDRLNEYKPHINILNSATKDIFTVNKGFIYGLFDDDNEQEENKFQHLAENNELANDIIDFSDPAALMRR